MKGQFILKFYYAVRNSFKMTRSEFAFFLSAVISTGIVVGILLSFIWFYQHSRRELKELLSFYRIVIFAEKPDEVWIKNIKEQLLKKKEIQSVRFLSEEEIMEMVSEFFNTVPPSLSPLPVIGEIKLKEKFLNDKDIRRIARELSTLEGISYVDAGLKHIDGLVKKVRYIKSAGLFVILFAVIGGFIVIYAFTNLALFSVQKKIEILKYVGAPNWFIRLPFIIRGIVIGGLGGVLALSVFYFLPPYNFFDMKTLLIYAPLYGTLSGFTGSLFAIRGHRL